VVDHEPTYQGRVTDDNQIYRLTAEKRLPGKRDRDALSTITIRRYNCDARTVADPRETRKHTYAPSNKRFERTRTWQAS
jgi:hypothetical protein